MEPLLINKVGSLFIGISFFIYGAFCIFDPHMAEEFKRYKIPRMRWPTAILQILGSLTILFFIYLSPGDRWLAAIHGFFAVMMLVALGIRLSIRDKMVKTLPAIFYLVFCAFMFHHLWFFGN